MPTPHRFLVRRFQVRRFQVPGLVRSSERTLNPPWNLEPANLEPGWTRFSASARLPVCCTWSTL